MNRAVVSDDGEHIRLLIYAHGLSEPLGVADLTTAQAATVCAELATSVASHLQRARSHRAGVRRGL